MAIDGLIDAVNDPDEIVRIAAIEALGRLKSTAAAPVLLDFLGNYELYEDEYSQLSDVLFEALDAVIDVPSIPTLEVLLNSSSYFARETSIRLLGKIKANSAIPQLMNILLDAPEGLRDVIFSALDEFANVSKPLEALSSSNPDKQQEAVEMLAEEYQTLGLLSALGYYRNKAQWATVTKLEKIITLADNTILIKALDSEVAAVRAFVAEVLGRRSDFEACDELLVLINDESSLVRGLAIRAVERLQCKTARSLLVARLKDTEKIFSDGEKRVCDFAAIALGKFGDKAAIDGLLTTLSGTDNELRIEATKLLGDLADKTISPKLRVVLSENNQAIREAALNVLSRIEFPSTSKTLLESLSDDAYSSRAEALDKIWSVAGTLGLITALDYGKSNVRWEISEKLVEVATLEDKDFFLEALKSNRLSLRAYAAETVGRRPDMQIAVHLYPLIDDEDTFVRGIAIRAIGRLGEKAAGALLKDRLNVRQQYLAMLATIFAILQQLHLVSWVNLSLFTTY